MKFSVCCLKCDGADNETITIPTPPHPQLYTTTSLQRCLPGFSETLPLKYITQQNQKRQQVDSKSKMKHNIMPIWKKKKFTSHAFHTKERIMPNDAAVDFTEIIGVEGQVAISPAAANREC